MIVPVFTFNRTSAPEIYRILLLIAVRYGLVIEDSHGLIRLSCSMDEV